MGMILCERHGMSGFHPDISKELSDTIRKNIVLDYSEISFVNVLFYDESDGELMFDIRYWMTKICIESLSALPRYEVWSDEDEKGLGSIFDSVMKHGGACVNCFEEYLILSKNLNSGSECFDKG